MSPETSLTQLIGRLTAIFATWAYLFASFQQIQSADSLVRIIDEDKLNFQVPFSSTLYHRLFSFLRHIPKWLPGGGFNELAQETARKCWRKFSGLPRADGAPRYLFPILRLKYPRWGRDAQLCDELFNGFSVSSREEHEIMWVAFRLPW